MNSKSSGVFKHDFRSISGPQKSFVQFRSSKPERAAEGKASVSDRPSLSAFAETGEEDIIFKEPFGDMPYASMCRKERWSPPLSSLSRSDGEVARQRRDGGASAAITTLRESPRSPRPAPSPTAPSTILRTVPLPTAARQGGKGIQRQVDFLRDAFAEKPSLTLRRTIQLGRRFVTLYAYNEAWQKNGQKRKPYLR